MSNNLSESENQHDKKQGAPLLTVKEVASLVDESVHVVRNWLKEFKTYIPLEKSDAGYNLFNEQAINVIQTIKELHRKNGYSIKQIEHYLMTGGKEFVPRPSPAAEELLANELKEIRSNMKEIHNMLEQQEKFNRALVEKLDKQQQYIDESIKSRDEILMKTIRELQETKRIEAAKEEENPNKKWWKFWN